LVCNINLADCVRRSRAFEHITDHPGLPHSQSWRNAPPAEVYLGLVAANRLIENVHAVSFRKSRLNREQSVGASYRQGTVANREPNSLGGPGTDIAGGQHSGKSRLEGTWIAICTGPQSGPNDIAAGQKIT